MWIFHLDKGALSFSKRMRNRNDICPSHLFFSSYQLLKHRWKNREQSNFKKHKVRNGLWIKQNAINFSIRFIRTLFIPRFTQPNHSPNPVHWSKIWISHGADTRRNILGGRNDKCHTCTNVPWIAWRTGFHTCFFFARVNSGYMRKHELLCWNIAATVDVFSLKFVLIFSKTCVAHHCGRFKPV